jgi:Kef-type K+ transport system membrane component KefB
MTVRDLAAPLPPLSFVHFSKILCPRLPPLLAVIAWCILAVVVAVTRAANGITALWVVLCALAFVVGLLVVVRPVLVLVTRRWLRTREDVTTGVIAVLLVLMFLCSWTTEVRGATEGVAWWS